ncbi:MAG: right-handed parallel beta-helix repeat-containing protein, partial [Chloroflexaceae bacterium]
VMVLVSVGASWSRPVQAQGEYVVDNIGDASLSALPTACTDTTVTDCSLRQAIQKSNADGGSSRITFNMPVVDIDPNGVTWTIKPQSPLPPLTENGTTIDGTSFDGDPTIVLSGEDLVSGVGLQIFNSSNNTIQGLIIVNFPGTTLNSGIGIYIFGSSATENQVVGNYIGNKFGEANTDDPTKYGNAQAGIKIDAQASQNTIGGTSSEERNYISGNKGDGIILSTNTISNTILGNYIGLIRVGAVFKLGNAGHGIQINNSQGNIVGGTTSDQRNIISGNSLTGVLLTGFSTMDNTIVGNYIGTDQNGFLDRGNGSDGVRISDGASDNVVTGTGAAPAVISGNGDLAAGDCRLNGGYGVLIRDRGTIGNQVVGSYIGVNKDGGQSIDIDLGNACGGVRIEDDASDNLIGGPVFNTNQRNVISGNTGYGVSIGRTTTGYTSVVSNTIAGNHIGVNLDGTQVISNTTGGVLVDLPANNTTIGGSTEAERNVISGNDGPGIFVNGTPVNGTTTLSTTITGNIIGLGRSGTATAANTGDGIRVTGGEILRIGGPTEAEGNLIAANGGDGIRLTDVVSTTVQSNRIGWVVDTATDQLLSLGNIGDGLAVTGSLTMSVTSNLVSGKGGGGIGNGMLFDAINTTEILSNTVTENAAGGLLLSDAFTTTIQANSVTANGDAGISLTDAYTATVQTNEVIDNGGNGVQVLGANVAPFNIRIADNNIYTNTIGVLVSGEPPNAPQQVKIVDNSISRNREVGINLTPDNTLALADADNPNHDIDPPIVDPLTIDPPLPLRLKMGITNGGLLSGYVITDTDGELPFYPAACVTCTVQIFKPDPELAAADGQGFAKAAEDVFPDETGYFEVQLSDVGTDGLPDQVLLTATDFAGNTSEYALFTVSRAVEIAPPRTEPSPVFPGEVFTYTHTVTNTGSVNDSFRLSASSSLTWTNSFEPSGPFELRAGESRPVTVTVTVPPGSNPNAAVDLPHTLTVTVTSTTDPDVDDSLENTTTVGGSRKVTFEPLVSAGLTQPGQIINYVHTIRNEGNLTATVNLDFDTTQPSWLTTLNKTSYTLGPGGVDQIRLSVTPPDQVIIAGTTAVVEINAGVVEDASQDQVLTDTTEIILDPQAILVPDRQGFAAAGETITFRHTATNRSNGQATFKIEGASSLGSEIRFESDTEIQLVDGNTFTVGFAEGNDFFNFLVHVTVSPRAREGAEDTVTIFLTDEEGRRLGGATVQDTIRITEGFFLVHLPIVAR